MTNDLMRKDYIPSTIFNMEVDREYRTLSEIWSGLFNIPWADRMVVYKASPVEIGFFFIAPSIVVKRKDVRREVKRYFREKNITGRHSEFTSNKFYYPIEETKSCLVAYLNKLIKKDTEVIEL